MMYQLCVSDYECVADNKPEDNHEAILQPNVPHKTYAGAEKAARAIFEEMWEGDEEFAKKHKPDFIFKIMEPWYGELGFWEFDDGEDTYRIYEIGGLLE